MNIKIESRKQKRPTQKMRMAFLAGETRYVFGNAVHLIACGKTENDYYIIYPLTRVSSNRAKQKRPTQKCVWRFWQGRRDSNTQPTVLETVALPLSHSPIA